MNVRFEANNGHDADVTRCLLMTQSGHSRRKTQWVRVRNGDQTITPRIAFATWLRPVPPKPREIRAGRKYPASQLLSLRWNAQRL